MESKGKGWVIAVIIFVILLIIGSCSGDGGSSSNYPYGYEQCPRCDGAGMVNDGFADFNTCRLCGGSGMIDSD